MSLRCLCVEPFLIASTVRAVVGQRLVRTLCPVCRETYTPATHDISQIKEIFGIGAHTSIDALHNLEAEAAGEGIGGTTEENSLSTTTKSIEKLWKPHEKGCKECGNSGYKGRMGIYEVLANTLEVQKMIVGNATSNAIQDQAVKEDMVTMQLDGLVKALRGLTSIEEILRVTRE